MLLRLFDLPHALLGDILTTWLNEVDYICFDNALCGKNVRQEYLDLIKSNDILITFPIQTRHDSSKYLIWLKLRDVYIEAFALPRFIANTEFNSKVFNKSKYLNFSNCGELDDQMFSQITKASKSLQEIVIGSNYYSNNITDSSINLISETSSQLRKIEICQSKLITDSAIIILTKKCRNLTDIKLINCIKIGDATINSIADNCPKLRILTITNNELITSTSIYQVYSKCLYLQELTVVDCTMKHNRATFDDHTQLNKKKNLLKLNLSRYKELPDNYLQNILHNNNLTHLNLEENQTITDATFFTIASMISTIITLNLSFCLLLTDIAIIELMKYCHALQEINLQACKITDEAVSHITINAPQLKRINFNWCLLLTDASLIHLSTVHSLTSISLIGCNHITYKSIHGLLSTVDNKIEQLNVSYCSRINTNHVEQLRNDFPSVDISHADFSHKPSL